MRTRCYGCMEEFDDAYGLCPNCGYEPDTDVDSPIHMQPGVVLHGRYLIGRVLGFGGFGVTYLGWDFTLQQKVAIKEYLPSEFATRMIGQTRVTVFGGKKEEQFDDGMEQFVQEARRLAQFQNEEGIVRIIDSFAENNTAYIVMEYLDGETLTAYLERNGKVDVDEAIRMLTPVLKSLEIIHRAGIIHRDIAPDNIYLTRDGKVKLIDFGAARYATTSHSRSLTVIIKPGYSPEEQYRSRGDQGPHTDVYAIGAVLYKMITGIVLPDSMERRACFEKNGKDIVIPASKNCKISKNQENAIMNALNVRVEDRTPTASQFMNELTAQKPVKRVFGKIKVTDLMRWPLWAKITIPAAGAAIVALLVLLLTGIIGPRGNLLTDIRLGENEARVPSVVNYTVDVAQDRLAAHNLRARIVGGEYSDVIPPNMVLYQSIVIGQVVEKQTVVEIYVSTDWGYDEEGVMPGVVYKAEKAAQKQLESMGMEVNVEYAYSDIVAEGLVISQSVEKGSDISIGGSVTLEISLGVDPNKKEATRELVVLSRESYDLYVADIVNVQAAGGNGKYKYNTSDSSVVTVSRDGELTAVGVGTATVTVTSRGAQSAVCTVTVRDYEMTINPSDLTLFVDATATVSVSGVPANAQIQWSSDDTDVVKVNETGKVTALATGEATITATWRNGENTYTATLPVTVEEYGLTLGTYKITSFYVGETRTIEAETAPADQTVTWTSSDESVVTVSPDGEVTAVGGGTATVTASFREFSESCSVTVTQPGVTLNKDSLTLYTTDTAALSASVTPNGTEVIWSSDNTAVVTVDNGNVVAVGAGTTTIRVKMTYANIAYEAVCEVKVTEPSVTISQTSLTLNPGESKSLTASADPGNAITWSCDNTGIATVNNGKVSSVSEGTTTIRAQMTYNGKTYQATCTVTVNKPSVTLSSGSLSMMPGDARTLTAKTVPSGSSVTWRSNNTSVATVSGGKVTAVGYGNATITAEISYGGKTYRATCNVVVVDPSIAISASADTIYYSEKERGTCTLTAMVNPAGSSITWHCSDTNVASISGNGTTATLTAKSEGTVTITASYTVGGKTVTDTHQITVKKAASTLTVSNVSYPGRGSVSSFYFNATISSNYSLWKLDGRGTAHSNALNISVSHSPDPLYFNEGVFVTGNTESNMIAQYLISQYRALYNLYVVAANVVGADDSLTMTINCTVYDRSGASKSLTIKYILDE